MKNNNPSNFCSICGQELEGRRDQVFCSLKCKNAYHRQRKRQHSEYTQTIDRYLHRNWVILQEVYEKVGKKKFQVPLSDLIDSGFNPDYHTTSVVNSKGKTYKYIYNFGWMNFSELEVLVVRKDKPK